MVQNQHDRKLCVHCQRNVFPVRPKPNMALLVLLFIFVIPGLIYLIIYGLTEETKCPICYNEVSERISYYHPPFRNGDPNSYDSSLIGGKVIRSEPTIMNPEGDYIDYIPPMDKQKEQVPKSREYCKFCGTELFDSEFEKCPNCGTTRS